MYEGYEGYEDWCASVNNDLHREMEDYFAMLDLYGNDFDFPEDYYYGNDF